MPGKHAQWSPSGAPFWYNNGQGCAARVLLPAKPETTSPAAEEGTRLHNLAEDYLNDRALPEKWGDWESIADYCAYVEGYQGDFALQVRIEEKVNLEPVTGEDATGTVDALVYSDDYLEVIDLKTGMKKVSPESNQLMIYAAAAAIELGYTGTTVRCTVHQGGAAYSCFYNTLALLEEAMKVRDYVQEAIRQDDPPYMPSENNCQWCPHVADCEAIQDYRDGVAALEFQVEAVEEEHLGDHLQMVGALRRWCDEIENRSLVLAEAGGQVTGFKLVRARTNRKWIADAEQKLVALLGDAAYDRKLLGLTAAGKLVDAETMDELTMKPEGKPTLAPEADKRPAINDAAADFKDA